MANSKNMKVLFKKKKHCFDLFGSKFHPKSNKTTLKKEKLVWLKNKYETYFCSDLASDKSDGFA